MVKGASVPAPSHDTNHNNCCHKAPLAFTDAFWAAMPSDLARWVSADMCCEIVELREDDYPFDLIVDVIEEREKNDPIGYPVNLLPETVERIANFNVSNT